MNKILVIDSGVGGLTTLKIMQEKMANEVFEYFADTQFMPYGNKTKKQIQHRIISIIKRYESEIKAVVLACNTATGVAIERVRSSFPTLVVVGTEPAIVPAVKNHPFGCILVLVTKLESKQKKLKQLIKKYPNVKVCPQKSLATSIENYIKKGDSIDKEIENINKLIAKYNASAIVLGCTHYSYISTFFDLPVYDSNVGVANRLFSLLKQQKGR